METFWQWEAKIQEQEVDYYEGLLRDLKREMDEETMSRLEEEGLQDFNLVSIKKKLSTD